jgi:acyl dehydratase
LRLYFDDFAPEQTYELGERTLSRDQIIAFATEFDPQPFHLNDAAAADNIYGSLIASGWHTGSTLMRLMADGLLVDSTSLGSPGLEELRWLKPVYPGDTVRGRCVIEQTRASRSKPDRGVVLIRAELRNQHDDLVLMMRSWGMFGRRATEVIDEARAT